MISIDKSVVKKPDILSDNEISKKLLGIKNDANPGKKITNLYNEAEVKVKLLKLYNNKCCACEQEAELEIDHFRPKNKIKEKTNHKGYYWLSYEWTNLLPICSRCNKFKSNQFPLKNENTRISDNLEQEGFLKNGEFIFENFKIQNLEKEERLLLNPEIDKVEEHLLFLPTGEITNLTEKDEKTIKIYKLNRNWLIDKRWNIIENQIDDIIKIFIEWGEDQKLKKRFFDFFNNELKPDKTKNYSRFRYFIFEYFDIFVVEKLKDMGFEIHAKELENFFNEWKKQL